MISIVNTSLYFTCIFQFNSSLHSQGAWFMCWFIGLTFTWKYHEPIKLSIMMLIVLESATNWVQSYSLFHPPMATIVLQTSFKVSQQSYTNCSRKIFIKWRFLNGNYKLSYGICAWTGLLNSAHVNINTHVYDTLFIPRMSLGQT